MAMEMDIGLVCWSALGGGMATGKYNRKLDTSVPQRLIDEVAPAKEHFWHQVTKRNLTVMDGVIKVAEEVGRPTVQVALRWLMQQKPVTIPVFSARTVEQVKEDLGAVDFTLTDEQMRKLDTASCPPSRPSCRKPVRTLTPCWSTAAPLCPTSTRGCCCSAALRRRSSTIGGLTITSTSANLNGNRDTERKRRRLYPEGRQGQ